MRENKVGTFGGNIRMWAPLKKRKVKEHFLTAFYLLHKGVD